MTLITEETADGALAHLGRVRGRPVGFDTETTGLQWSQSDRIAGIALAFDGESHYWPFRHAPGQNLHPCYIRAVLRELEHHDLVGYNTKFDMHMARRDYEPFLPQRSHADGLLLAHLANENEESFEFKVLARKYLGPTPEADALDALLASRKLKKGDIARLTGAEVEPYACADARLHLGMHDFARKRVDQWKLGHIANELPAYVEATLEMEERGIALDMERLDDLASRAEPGLDAARGRLAGIVGRPINVNSSKQVCAALGTRDSKHATLSVLDTPAAAAVMEARQWSKVQTSYVDTYRRHVGSDGALHPSFHLAGTVAGRPSCSAPNLQAVARTSEVYKIKHCFVARPGYTLLSADYSQAELRLGAHYAKDAAMLTILESGGDVHGATAKRLGLSRDHAKRINFGIVYGLGAPGLSKQLNITEEKARSILAVWHRGFPGFRAVYKRAVATATERGYIRMWTGRVRRFVGDRSPPRKAFSALVQGGVAEVMRVAICRMHARGLRLLLQVHDQVLLEVPNDSVQDCARVVRECMEDFDFSCRLRVDLAAGPSWGELEKL